MALRDYLKPSATAIPAIPATHGSRIARIARIAVADPANQDHALREVRRLVERVAALAPNYWTVEDIEEVVTISARDVDTAIETWRNVLRDNGGAIH